jgi:glycosyltransferase involved in cell wall biosynthesis
LNFLNNDLPSKQYEPLIDLSSQNFSQKNEIPLSGKTIQAASISTNQREYDEWILQNEPSYQELKDQIQVSKDYAYRPKISIITPVYNTPLAILESAIQSVVEQTYDNWELCIVDGHSNSDNMGIKKILINFLKEDERIKCKFLERNLGISGNTNVAFSMATGEFFVFLDHDDILAPFALFEIVKSLNNQRDLDVIYSDKDLISEDGKIRFNPLFKPDWSPEMLFSANYLAHLCVIRKNLIETNELFNSKMDGAQDWDFFFRITENTDRIYHIPCVLYHWRCTETSCAESGPCAKPYIFTAQKIALEEHIKRCGLNGDVIFKDPHFWAVKWNLSSIKKISIIIQSKNICTLKKCIHSIINLTTYKNYEIIILDIGINKLSDPEFYEGLLKNEFVHIIKYSGILNYSIINNLCRQHATGDIFFFLHENLKVISSDWIEDMMGWAIQTDIGVVGAQLLKPTGTIEQAGIIIGLTGFVGYPFAGSIENTTSPFGSTEWYRNYLAVSGAWMVRREIFEECGGFNENFAFLGSELEFCLNVRQNGYRILYTPFVKFEHLETVTTGKTISIKECQLLFESCISYLSNGDPYFNKNLSLWSTIPKIKNPGENDPIDRINKIIQRDSVPVDDSLLTPDLMNILYELFNFFERIPDIDICLSVAAPIPNEISSEIILPGMPISNSYDNPSSIQKLEAQISDLNLQLSRRNDEFSELQVKINAIEHSVVWRLTQKFDFVFIERLFPRGSKRRQYYSKALIRTRTLLDKKPVLCSSNWISRFFPNKKNEWSQYHLFVEKKEHNANDLIQQKEKCKNFQYTPVISIILPVWETDRKLLSLTIESVINQTYENWELCIADGGSYKLYIKELLVKYGEKDARIKVKFLEENKGISGNSNEALSFATGEYVGFLDHDDILSPDALYEVVKILNDNRNLEIIYSDNDKIDENEFHREPFIKPDWSLAMFLSTHYLFHFCIFQRNLVEHLGGLRSDYDGAQDYDLALRVVDYVKSENIGHIPKVLYHWRITSASLASGGNSAKPYAYDAGKRALEDYLIRNNLQGEVIKLEPGSYWIKYSVMQDLQVGIVILSKRNIGNLSKIINRLLGFSTYKISTVFVPNPLEKKTANATIVEYSNSSKKLSELINVSSLQYVIFIDLDDLSQKYINLLKKDWIETLLMEYTSGKRGLVGTGTPTFGNIVHPVHRPCGPIFCITCELFQHFSSSHEIDCNYDDYQIILADFAEINGYENICTPHCGGNMTGVDTISKYYSNSKPRFYFKKSRCNKEVQWTK